MILSLLLTAALSSTAADTTILVRSQASLMGQRPEVALVREGDQSFLVVRARDPLFFNRSVATLYPKADTTGTSVAVLSSDSSAVDARSNTNWHMLRFPVTVAQLRQWAVGNKPSIEVGGLWVKLPGGGRKDLKRLTTSPAVAPTP